MAELLPPSSIDDGKSVDSYCKNAGYKILSNSTREAIYKTVISLSQNDKKFHGIFVKVGKLFRTSRQSVRRIWLRGQESLTNSSTGLVDVSHRKSMCGRKPKFSKEDLRRKIKEIPLRSRKTSRDTAVALGISQTYVLYLMKKYKLFRAASLSVKPTLTDKHRSARVAFVKEKIAAYCQTHFDPQYQTIHIDEKWFQKKETRQRAYLADDEEAKAETVQHKSHIEKVMFLAAVARPRKYRQRRGTEPVSVVCNNGELISNIDFFKKTTRESDIDCSLIEEKWYFNGKIGVYPLTEITLAKETR
jgi:hypothetical protein